MSSFRLIQPTAPQVPILLSIPHCGTEFPQELKAQYRPELIAAPDDTDWFVQQLYDFAAAMGISVIHSTFSRWVIDLNRDPNSKPLYTDGRIITPLCPATTFMGEPIYNDARAEVDPVEVKRRVAVYYNPYHEHLAKKLFELKSRFGKVLLWECHSIRQLVPTIQPDKFPDLILGTNDGKSADAGMIETVLTELKKGKYSVNLNSPFKGGYITRHFGNPSDNQHAMQLEMTKVNYMDDSETKYDKKRAEEIRGILKKVFSALVRKWLT
ncbi:MAG TPA: N-formylglutamate amidohydrolase [Cyclobacteriaceae bacterium]|nr:N-formylglutamate amidohydrolase [Cyclobacteriaceae bacterium]